MKLEKIIGQLGVLITAGVLTLASPNYVDAKVIKTKTEKRRDGTIVRIYDDEVKDANTQVKEGDKLGAYLKPVYFCNKCKASHVDTNRKKVELGFQTKGGRIVDYLPQTKRSQSETYETPTDQEVRDFNQEKLNERYRAVIEQELGIPSQK